MNKIIKKVVHYRKPYINKKKIKINFFTSARSMNGSLLDGNDVLLTHSGAYIPCMG